MCNLMRTSEAQQTALDRINVFHYRYNSVAGFEREACQIFEFET